MTLLTPNFLRGVRPDRKHEYIFIPWKTFQLTPPPNTTTEGSLSVPNEITLLTHVTFPTQIRLPKPFPVPPSHQTRSSLTNPLLLKSLLPPVAFDLLNTVSSRLLLFPVFLPVLFHFYFGNRKDPRLLPVSRGLPITLSTDDPSTKSVCGLTSLDPSFVFSWTKRSSEPPFVHVETQPDLPSFIPTSSLFSTL